MSRNATKGFLFLMLALIITGLGLSPIQAENKTKVTEPGKEEKKSIRIKEAVKKTRNDKYKKVKKEEKWGKKRISAFYAYKKYTVPISLMEKDLKLFKGNIKSSPLSSFLSYLKLIEGKHTLKERLEYIDDPKTFMGILERHIKKHGNYQKALKASGEREKKRPKLLYKRIIGEYIFDDLWLFVYEQKLKGSKRVLRLSQVLVKKENQFLISLSKQRTNDTYKVISSNRYSELTGIIPEEVEDPYAPKGLKRSIELFSKRKWGHREYVRGSVSYFDFKRHIPSLLGEKIELSSEFKWEKKGGCFETFLSFVALLNKKHSLKDRLEFYDKTLYFKDIKEKLYKENWGKQKARRKKSDNIRIYNLRRLDKKACLESFNTLKKILSSNLEEKSRYLDIDKLGKKFIWKSPIVVTYYETFDGKTEFQAVVFVKEKDRYVIGTKKDAIGYANYFHHQTTRWIWSAKYKGKENMEEHVKRFRLNNTGFFKWESK